MTVSVFLPPGVTVTIWHFSGLSLRYGKSSLVKHTYHDRESTALTLAVLATRTLDKHIDGYPPCQNHTTPDQLRSESCYRTVQTTHMCFSAKRILMHSQD
jgi:hypothetical protein